MKRLVVLRHGLTPWNAERRFQGQADVSLASEGELQAKAAAVALASLQPAVLWTSDLTRAAQTAAAVAESTGLSPVREPRLREVHVGAFQGLHYDDAVARFGPGPWDYSQYGGESDATVAERVAAALGELADVVGEGQVGVAVSHGAAIRAGVGAFLGLPAEHLRVLGTMVNCGWVELVRGDGDDGWRLAAYNRVAPIS
jgi:probable phosphoglycerate mutase